jgi:hypothetical protein
MPAKSNWTMTLYGSDTDTATIPATVDATYGGALMLISSLTTPTSKSVYILAPQFDYVFNTGTLEDVSGSVLGFTDRRIQFQIETYPFSYDATAVTLEQDMEDMIALANIVKDKDYLYLRVDGGSRAYPAATYVYPVTLTAWNTAINKQFGNRTLTLTFEHRKRS